MRVVNVEQGTDAWYRARIGLVTASHFSDLMSQVNSGESAGRRNYRARLVCEILTGEPYQEDFQSEDMKRGIEVEAEARAAYEAVTMQKVAQVGLILHPKYDRIAASPDGIIVGTKGLVEFKCPKTGTHLETLLLGVTPSKYRKQMLAQMMCAESDYVDFCSYDPRLPKEYQLIIFRFMRDEKEIILMEAAALQFLAEVDQTIEQIKQQPVFRGI